MSQHNTNPGTDYHHLKKQNKKYNGTMVFGDYIQVGNNHGQVTHWKHFNNHTAKLIKLNHHPIYIRINQQQMALASRNLYSRLVAAWWTKSVCQNYLTNIGHSSTLLPPRYSSTGYNLLYNGCLRVTPLLIRLGYMVGEEKNGLCFHLFGLCIIYITEFVFFTRKLTNKNK